MRLSYVSHAEVMIDPAVPVPEWRLSNLGRARTTALAARGWPGPLFRIVTSPERKARETAEILAAPLTIVPVLAPNTAEIDRSSTGYVPHARHEALADAMFSSPEFSAAGWERAVDAQRRMAGALQRLQQDSGDLVMVGHGGVGTLLWCHVTGSAISRAEDQPCGGHVWQVDLSGTDARVIHRWRLFEQFGQV